MATILDRSKVEAMAEAAKEVVIIASEDGFKTSSGFEVYLGGCSCLQEDKGFLQVSISMAGGIDFTLCCHQMALGKHLLGGNCTLKQYKQLVKEFNSPSEVLPQVDPERTAKIALYNKLYQRALEVSFVGGEKAVDDYRKGKTHFVSAIGKLDGKPTEWVVSYTGCSCPAHFWSKPEGTVKLTTGERICKHSLALRLQAHHNVDQLVECLQPEYVSSPSQRHLYAVVATASPWNPPTEEPKPAPSKTRKTTKTARK